MLHNPNQQYMMYPMMDQTFQWKNQQQSVDSARASKSHGHSKSSSHEKEMKKSHKNNNKSNMPNMNNAVMNQFVPIYYGLPPGFTGHPGALNAALAAHQQQNGQQNQMAQNMPNMPQMAQNGTHMPTYGHNMYPTPNNPYGFYGYPAPVQPKGFYQSQQSGYSGSDYNSGHDSSTRNSKSSDSGSNKMVRNSGSLTSKDSGHSHGSNNKKGTTIKKPNAKKNNNVKKFQSTHQITIKKGPKHPVKIQQSCGRSHSTGSDLSAGCSASNCPPVLNRVCSHDSDNSNNNVRPISQDKVVVKGCCSNECETNHNTSLFENINVRKFSNNTDFKKPDSELTKKLISLIEFYLSDEYLAKDKYLLRQIRCKSEGYISIKLMTSFKKVKKLTRDWRSVRFALEQSPNLIVSPEGFRVKRATDLPENLRKPRLLSQVVTIRLTEELSTVDAITNLFAKYGEIGVVRILKPGKEIPSDLRNYATQVPDIGKTMCAVVEFEQSESALQAVRLLKDEMVENKMRLALLGPRVRRTLYKQDNKDGDEDEDENEATDINNVEPTEIDNVISESISKMQLKNNSSTESGHSSSSNTTHSSIDLSIDSGNCNISEHHSETESFDNKDENSQKNLLNERKSNNQNIIIVNNKISTIFREPEGPGVNAENGFAFKRSSN
jgi:hypothetical protein